MGNFFPELKRRRIYRVVAAYAVVGWVLLQLVNNVAPIMEAPAWVTPSALLFLVLGFPIAIFFTWTREQPAADGISPPRATTTDWVLIAVSVFVVGIVSYEQLTQPRLTRDLSSVQGSRGAAPTGISLAVLPFANLSSDPEQEFFSDGITEEITTALAKVPDLRVVARTSAFEFKGQNRNIQNISQQLHAGYFIEGSVIKEGNRVRITAQLIKAEDGKHIWAGDYDRELADVFAIQEDIARTVTASLNMQLGLKLGENLVNNRSIAPESYQQYLRANAQIRVRAQRLRLAEATALLEQVVARNPGFAPGRAALARALYFTVLTNPSRARGSTDEYREVAYVYLPKAEAAAERAIQLNPNLPEAHLALSGPLVERGNMLSADESISKAFELDPYNPIALNGRSVTLAISGHLKEANAIRQQLRALEPFLPGYNALTARYLWVAGDNDAAIAILKALPSDTPKLSYDFAMIYASMGQYQEAAELLEQTPPRGNDLEIVKEAARLLREAPAGAARSQDLPQLGNLDWVYLYAGAPERALDWYERNVDGGFPGGAALATIWHVSYAPARKTERFKTYVRKLRLVEYWRAKGWPEFCHPTTSDDFECN